MEDILVRRIAQIHAAFSKLDDSDLNSIKPHITNSENGIQAYIDFDEHSDPIILRNVAEQLIANIASIKDHLKHWCRQNKQSFSGDELINCHKQMAIIHDLWNIQKHGLFDSPPRSGTVPDLRDIKTVLKMSVGDESGASVVFEIDPFTGKTSKKTTGSGKVFLSLDADVFDRDGTYLGNFRDICEKATEGWINELRRLGILI